MSKINKVVVKGVSYDIEDKNAASKALHYNSFNAISTANAVRLGGKSLDGTNTLSLDIPAATTETAGVMSAEDKKVTVISKVKVTDAKFTQQDYAGIYCTNVNTGRVDTANSTSNGVIISVNEGDVFEIIGENLKYTKSSVQFYSGYPSLDTFVSNVNIYNNKVTVPQGATYMLVSVNPSLGTETVVKQLYWETVEDLPKSYEETLENIGSEYKSQVINVTQGVAAGDNRIFPISMLGEGDIIQIYVKSDIDTKMSLVTHNGHVIQSIITNQIIIKEIAANDITGNSFGFYINQTQATQSGVLNCFLRIIKKDSSDITLSKSLINFANTPKDISDINKNLGSKHQELIANVKVGEMLDARNFISTDIEAGYAIEFIAESDSDVKYRILTGDGKNVEGYAIYYNSNVLYRVNAHTIFVTSLRNATRWGLFVDVANATVNTSIRFRARIIKNDSFSYDSKIKRLSDEIGVSVNNPYSKYELFTLGDSLSSGGVWQAKVAELIGCTFDQSKNVKPGAMLSVGGTYSYGDSFDTVLWRAKNLIDQGYIADEGENAIVILENVNDGYVAFDEGAKSLIPTDPIEGYALADFGSALLESITDKARLNAVLRLTKTQTGKNLKITTLPTKPGTITLRVGWAGPGVSTYNIQIEPKSTTEETLAGIIDKIMEYAYTGVTDTLGEDGASVDFCSGNSNYMPTVEFDDTGNTGMRVTITDNPNAKGSVAKFFVGDSVEEWTDTSKWVVPSYSQGWKSTIELLQRTYPKLHIFVSQFPMHSVTASEYLLPNGSYDSVAYNSTGRMVNMRKMEVELKKIADFYSLPFLNVFRECGIGINNMLSYYNASANVHPKNEGYYRFGETVAVQLKRYLL